MNNMIKRCVSIIICIIIIMISVEGNNEVQADVASKSDNSQEIKYENILGTTFTGRSAYDTEYICDTCREAGYTSENKAENILITKEFPELTGINLKSYLLNNPSELEKVVVAVIDTGIDKSSEQFMDRIIDIGANYSNSGNSGDVSDDNGHGTAISNIILNSTTDNVKVMPIKVANNFGQANTESVYNGIRTAIDNNVNLINISLNAVINSDSTLINSIIKEAKDKGIPCIVSAGNNASDVANYTPSNSDDAIVVSALNTDMTFNVKSNFGQYVDYAVSGYSEYAPSVSGTSVAAANMSSAIALIESYNNEYSIEVIQYFLDKNAKDSGNTGTDYYFGRGYVDVDKLIIVNIMASRILEYINSKYGESSKCINVNEQETKVEEVLNNNIQFNNSEMTFSVSTYGYNYCEGCQSRWVNIECYSDYWSGYHCESCGRESTTDGSSNGVHYRFFGYINAYGSAWIETGQWQWWRCSWNGGGSQGQSGQIEGTIIDTYCPGHPWQHTVVYSANGGTGAPSAFVKTYGYGASYSSQIPTRDGYTFGGWYNDHTGGTYQPGWGYGDDYNGGTVVLYAVWNPISYTVSYDGNGATGGSTASQSKAFGSAYQLSGNGFVKQYSVTYNGNGGTPTVASNVASATFNGWEDWNSITVDNKWLSNLIFNAPYYANYYSDLRNAIGYNKYALAQHWINNTVLGGENRRASRYFDMDCYVGNGGSDLNAAFGGNWWLYPNHYQSNGYNEGRYAGGVDTWSSSLYPNYAWVANLGTSNGQSIVLYANWTNGSVTLPTATRIGYTFNGWYADAGLTNKVGNAGDSYTPTSNATLYAKWKPNKYKVTFYDVLYNEDGKSLGKKEEYIDYGTSVSGALMGTDTTPGIYYKDKYVLSNGKDFYNDLYYTGCTSATVTTDGATVYRFFARSLAVAAVIEHNDGRDGTCPTDNNFTTGEKAVLKITTFGYADSVDISYPTEFLNARAYGTIPKIENESITIVPDKIGTCETTFTIPLYDVVEGLYSININANRSIDNSVATTTPSLSIGKDLLKGLKNTIKSYPSTKW